ncbi:MAG: PAS domain S-box protein [Candidatus Krumholzibacteriia bacterium]
MPETDPQRTARTADHERTAGDAQAGGADDRSGARSDRDLRRERELLYLVLVASNDGYWDWNLDDDSVFMSDRWYEILGYQPLEREPTGTWLRGLLHPEDRSDSDARMERILAGPDAGDRVEMEQRLRHAAGGYRWLLVRALVARRDAAGRALRLCGTITDVTERRSALEQLAEKTQQLEGLFEHGPAGLALFDACPPYRILAHNRVYQDYWPEPYRSGGMIGRSLTEYLPLAEENGVLEVFRTVAASGQGRTLYEFPFDGTDGNRTWWNWNLSPIVRSGRVVAFAHMLLDVTETVLSRRSLEILVAERTAELSQVNAELVARQELLQKILDSIPVLLTFYRGDGSFGLINREFERVTGWTSEEILAMDDPMAHFYPDPAERAEVWEFMVRAEPGWRDFRPRCKDGSLLESRWANVRLSDGSQVGLGIDLTGQRRIEAELAERTRVAERRASQLQHMALELTQAEESERRRVAQNLHDNLQQLLVGTKLRLGALRSRCRDTELAPLALEVDEQLNDAIEASRSLTRDLSPPVLYEEGLAAGLDWLARSLRERQGLEVSVSYEAEGEPAGQTLSVFLFQAVRELLFNVVKHARTRRASVVVTEHSDLRLQVAVTDEGEGFDPEEADQSQVTGYGLFSIRERIELLLGEMVIESAPGRGTRILLRVPHTPLLRPRPEAVGDRRVAAAVRASAVREEDALVRILLVDDHAMVRDGVHALLADVPGMAVVGEAATGDEALRLTDQLQPDVVVLDIGLPDMSGVEVARRIRERWRQMRIVGLSMHDEADMAEKMLAAGADIYLHKGGPADELLAALQSAAPPVPQDRQ